MTHEKGTVHTIVVVLVVLALGGLGFWYLSTHPNTFENAPTDTSTPLPPALPE